MGAVVIFSSSEVAGVYAGDISLSEEWRDVVVTEVLIVGEWREPRRRERSVVASPSSGSKRVRDLDSSASKVGLGSSWRERKGVGFQCFAAVFSASRISSTTGRFKGFSSQQRVVISQRSSV
jgi:hypothetical protein